MLSAAELSAITAYQKQFMTDACVVVTKTTASDTAGGRSTSWTGATSTTCRVAPTGNQPQEQIIAQRAGTTAVYTISLPVSVTVTAKDRLVVDGRTFEVIGVLARSTDWKTVTRCVCVEVL